MNRQYFFVGFISLVLSVALVGCGGGNEGSTTADSTESSAPGGQGSVVATVDFEGEVPEPETFDASGNSECAKNTIESREVIVNDNGTLRNAVVAVKSGPSGLDRSPEPVTVDQENCMYEPHVVTAKAGQSITYEDSDPSMHNVRATRDGTQVFNITTFEGGSKSKTFQDPGAYSLVCNVHPWMQGWVYVTNHGYASVTDGSGEATLEALPAGDYTLEFWHEKYGTQTKDVTVEADGTTSVSATFSE